MPELWDICHGQLQTEVDLEKREVCYSQQTWKGRGIKATGIKHRIIGLEVCPCWVSVFDTVFAHYVLFPLFWNVNIYCIMEVCNLLFDLRDCCESQKKIWTQDF